MSIHDFDLEGRLHLAAGRGETAAKVAEERGYRPRTVSMLAVDMGLKLPPEGRTHGDEIIASLRAISRDGASHSDAVRALGIPSPTVTRLSKKYDIRFTPARPRNQHSKE